MSLILKYITLLTTVVDLGGVRRGVLHLTGRDRHYKKKKQKQPPCVLCKKAFLEISQMSQENTCARVSFLINFIKKETLAQVFSCEIFEISKNTFFTEYLRPTASEKN